MPHTSRILKKMLPDRGDFVPGRGERILLEIAAAYLDGMDHDLLLMAGQVVLDRLTPVGRQRVVKPEPRLSAEVIAAGAHDLMGDGPLALDSCRDMAKSFSGYRCRVTVLPVGLVSGGLEISLRVLEHP